VSDLEERVLAVLRALVPGEVVSYGDVADDAGFPRRARAVGHLLATTAERLPWWRVVTSNGRLVPGHEVEQSRRLRAERVVVRDGRVVAAPLGRFSRPVPPRGQHRPAPRPERPPEPSSP
jgi:methylated-DNA-protein-cysteine methyltransferase related protein